jgi:dienelactone hydrolase
MKLIGGFLFLIISASTFATGESISYKVNGETFEGYYTSPTANAPLVLLIHDWDGLTDYEIKRAEMLSTLGYAVFAADLFGAGVRPTEVTDKRQHTGALYKDRKKMRINNPGIALSNSLKRHSDNIYYAK